jgi:hypothetical protein
MIGLTHALAVDLGPEGITVNCIWRKSDAARIVNIARANEPLLAQVQYGRIISLHLRETNQGRRVGIKRVKWALAENYRGTGKRCRVKPKANDPSTSTIRRTTKLLAITIAVAGELSVLRERLDTIERLASAKGLLSLDEVDGYRPDEHVSAEREKWRADYLERILRVVCHELESAEWITPEWRFVSDNTVHGCRDAYRAPAVGAICECSHPGRENSARST